MVCSGRFRPSPANRPHEDGTLDVRRDATVEAIERVMPSVVNVEGSADVDPNSADDRLMAEFFGWRLQQVRRPLSAVVPAWSSTKKATY